ncbi:leucine-rich repeat protein [Diplonema papillatum]|nr:leucine-rich repeat protein [Diplonema papillatum]
MNGEELDTSRSAGGQVFPEVRENEWTFACVVYDEPKGMLNLKVVHRPPDVQSPEQSSELGLCVGASMVTGTEKVWLGSAVTLPGYSKSEREQKSYFYGSIGPASIIPRLVSSTWVDAASRLPPGEATDRKTGRRDAARQPAKPACVRLAPSAPKAGRMQPARRRDGRRPDASYTRACFAAKRSPAAGRRGSRKPSRGGSNGGVDSPAGPGSALGATVASTALQSAFESTGTSCTLHGSAGDGEPGLGGSQSWWACEELSGVAVDNASVALCAAAVLLPVGGPAAPGEEHVAGPGLLAGTQGPGLLTGAQGQPPESPEAGAQEDANRRKAADGHTAVPPASQPDDGLGTQAGELGAAAAPEDAGAGVVEARSGGFGPPARSGDEGDDSNQRNDGNDENARNDENERNERNDGNDENEGNERNDGNDENAGDEKNARNERNDGNDENARNDENDENERNDENEGNERNDGNDENAGDEKNARNQRNDGNDENEGNERSDGNDETAKDERNERNQRNDGNEVNAVNDGNDEDNERNEGNARNKRNERAAPHARRGRAVESGGDRVLEAVAGASAAPGFALRLLARGAGARLTRWMLVAGPPTLKPVLWVVLAHAEPSDLVAYRHGAATSRCPVRAFAGLQGWAGARPAGEPADIECHAEVLALAQSVSGGVFPALEAGAAAIAAERKAWLGGRANSPAAKGRGDRAKHTRRHNGTQASGRSGGEGSGEPASAAAPVEVVFTGHGIAGCVAAVLCRVFRCVTASRGDTPGRGSPERSDPGTQPDKTEGQPRDLPPGSSPGEPYETGAEPDEVVQGRPAGNPREQQANEAGSASPEPEPARNVADHIDTPLDGRLPGADGEVQQATPVARCVVFGSPPCFKVQAAGGEAEPARAGGAPPLTVYVNGNDVVARAFSAKLLKDAGVLTKLGLHGAGQLQEGDRKQLTGYTFDDDAHPASCVYCVLSRTGAAEPGSGAQGVAKSITHSSDEVAGAYRLLTASLSDHGLRAYLFSVLHANGAGARYKKTAGVLRQWRWSGEGGGGARVGKLLRPPPAVGLLVDGVTGELKEGVVEVLREGFYPVLTGEEWDGGAAAAMDERGWQFVEERFGVKAVDAAVAAYAIGCGGVPSAAAVPPSLRAMPVGDSLEAMCHSSPEVIVAALRRMGFRLVADGPRLCAVKIRHPKIPTLSDILESSTGTEPPLLVHAHAGPPELSPAAAELFASIFALAHRRWTGAGAGRPRQRQLTGRGCDGPAGERLPRLPLAVVVRMARLVMGRSLPEGCVAYPLAHDAMGKGAEAGGGGDADGVAEAGFCAVFRWLAATQDGCLLWTGLRRCRVQSDLTLPDDFAEASPLVAACDPAGKRKAAESNAGESAAAAAARAQRRSAASLAALYDECKVNLAALAARSRRRGTSRALVPQAPQPDPPGSRRRAAAARRALKALQSAVVADRTARKADLARIALPPSFYLDMAGVSRYLVRSSDKEYRARCTAEHPQKIEETEDSLTLPALVQG